MWPTEPIPDGDPLFYRIHKSDFVEGEIVPGAFRERGEGAAKGMSTDWEKYSTALEAWNRSKIPADNLIVEFVVEKVREEGLEVAHDPLPDNRAHSHIKGIPHEGQLKVRARLMLKRICRFNNDVLSEHSRMGWEWYQNQRRSDV